MFKYIFILMLGAAPAGAQQLFMGAEAGPDAFTKAEKVKLNQQDEDIFAKAFVLENSTAALYAVFESTAPAQAAASHMRRGIYRRELLILFAIARDSKTTFKALAKERDKGATLREIAKNNKADLMRIFRETEELQKKIEIRAASIDISTGALAVGISTAAVQVSTSAAFAVDASSGPVQVSTSPALALPVENEKK
jgi:hypothetical protein